MITNQDSQRIKQIAVIGAGYWGKNLVRNFHALGHLKSVCESNPELKSALAEQYADCEIVDSVDTVLSDPEILGVAIATPAETHFEMVKRAINAGKHVFVEKPLALTAEEGEILVALAEEKERTLMVGHLLWYHAAVQKLKELVDGGELGRIQYIYSHRLNLGKIRREENILWSFAPHDISVTLGLLGEMPNEVHTQGGNYLHPEIADVTVSLLSFPSGVKAHIFVSWLHPYKEQKLIVVGDRKMAVFDDLEPENKLVLYPHSIEWKDNLPVPNKADAEPVKLEMGEPLREECDHFVQCFTTQTPPKTDGREALRVLKVLQQCEESLGRSSNSPTSATSETDYQAHESAFIDDDVAIGKGTAIWHVSHVMRGSKIGRDCRIGQNVVIGPNASIGDGVKIQNNVSVYEGVTLEDHVFCGPSMVFTNVHNPRSEVRRMDEMRPTLVRQGASLGANCTIICGTTVGRYAFVGAGSVVTKDVPDHALVMGNPARITGWMCECGVQLAWNDSNSATCQCGRSYIKEGDEVAPTSQQNQNSISISKPK